MDGMEQANAELKATVSRLNRLVEQKDAEVKRLKECLSKYE